MDTKTEFSKALFGDSLIFTVNVSDQEVPLSTLKAHLYYGEELVSETVIRTKTNGDYTGKIYIPYYADIPNGTATLKLVLQNIHFTLTEQTYDLSLERPDYPYLTLVAGEETYRMERTDLYTYAATANFPIKVNAYIQAPKVGEAGNELTFGWEDNAIKEGSLTNIPFSNRSAGQYSITFNSLTYEAAPFIIAYAINETVMQRIDDNHYKLDMNLTNGQELAFEGISDFADWWIDPDYLTKVSDNTLKFAAPDGQYRIIANFQYKYFAVEKLVNGEPAKLQADGSGAVWIIGEGIGKPSVSTNAVGWDTGKALCMVPLGNKKYQITVVAGTTVNADNINFKFFHQKDWGDEFNNTSLSTTSDVIFIGDGKNGRDPGNLGIVEGKKLENGATYVFTIDLSEGNNKAILTVVKQ
ncbi:hypothetical protein GCM10023231_27030 [Olivibacter ginsenosidimutans]|uniref:DUF5125 domain-containing protein n=2 Tax=Olivibacter ginsenosidimutans TaxID=1176537 RepID=A0ABP9BLI3_9SPHI